MGNFHNYRALQVELWEDCNHRCSFCYLSNNRRITTVEQKLEAIKKTHKILDGVTEKYNAFGLIGGEFFDTQLSTDELKEAFITLIKRLDNLIDEEIFYQVWITSALIADAREMFFEVMSNIKNREKFLICTSYDTVGRFRTQARKQLWFENLYFVKGMGFPVHIQVITTSDFIREALTTDILNKLGDRNMVDFKTPTPHRDAYLDAVLTKTGTTYRDAIKSNMDKFSPTFFIDDRQAFLRFMMKVKDIFGPEKLEAFCSNEVRSDELHLLSKGIVIKDRWGEGIENAPCGHPWDSYCYKYDDKCARCDVENLLDD